MKDVCLREGCGRPTEPGHSSCSTLCYALGIRLDKRRAAVEVAGLGTKALCQERLDVLETAIGWIDEDRRLGEEITAARAIERRKAPSRSPGPKPS